MRRLLIAALLAASLDAGAAVIGYMTPPEPLTAARIAQLPAAEQQAWQVYLARSQARMAADKAALAAERGAAEAVPPPPAGRPGEASMPLRRPANWYASAAARHIADNIVSFQTPSGGWGKNVDRSGPLRLPGQPYVSADSLPAGVAGPKPEAWSFVGTIDNDATLTELRFLARVQAQAPGADGNAYRASFEKGMRYLFEAQYPNGGFPQVYPLQGGYHDAITFNDNAIGGVLELLLLVAQRSGDYAFVPPALAEQARSAAERTLAMVVATQIRVGGVATGWCQQHDALSLAPVGARNFEPPAIASLESAELLSTLMQLHAPSPAVVAAVHAGVAWLRQAALRDIAWGAVSAEEGRQMRAAPGAGPLWARLYAIGDLRPVFGDRDRSIHDQVNEISRERRNGYGWYGTGPARTLEAYALWAPLHP
ncbi:pectate lyase [Massilia sp. TS11]|uniref:pectate lyase n=1 Tax=Massilia sp. TS11 TaxID=2908003 RepID=UPI001ED9CE65|nr:pectate lyase [Massilia sp. TS11]MCG2583749.1 pectate lyase [Massilia sp. TS11]